MGSNVQPPRLLPLNARVDQRLGPPSFEATWFVGTQRWQVLRSNEPGSEIIAPYDRSVQLGVGLDSDLPLGMRFGIESELNRFTRADGLPNRPLPLDAEYKPKPLLQVIQRFCSRQA